MTINFFTLIYIYSLLSLLQYSKRIADIPANHDWIGSEMPGCCQRAQHGRLCSPAVRNVAAEACDESQPCPRSQRDNESKVDGDALESEGKLPGNSLTAGGGSEDFRSTFVDQPAKVDHTELDL